MIAIAFFPVLVLLLLAGGVLLIVFSRRGGPDHPACGKCGYNVHASIGSVTRCPECGADFAQAGITPPQDKRTRNPFMLVGGVVLIVLSVSCFGWNTMFWAAARQSKSRAPAATVDALLNAPALEPAAEPETEEDPEAD